jgi:glutamate/tyrosine decarboxylase-like PLP-dependent enzyme
VADASADLITAADSRRTFPETSGELSERIFSADVPEEGLGASAFDAFADVVAHSRINNGRFFGYILGSGEPVAAFADLLASALNQNVTAWRSGPAAVVIERTVVRWLGEAIGCAGFAGSLTGGGSSANLMALAMARESRTPANKGGAQAGVVYASEEVHMSIPKAVALLGLGTDNLRRIPVDADYRIRVDELERAIAHDVATGRKPMAIVASAGTVNTGAIDPLERTAEVAKKHGLWLHVDGAYGALAAIAARPKFAGLASADSISLDPHKWLYQPLDCGCLLFRDASVARAAFADSGDYARPLQLNPLEGFAFFEESLELSRRFRGLKLWMSLRYHGMSKFRKSISEDLRLAQLLADKITAHPEMELTAPVELSVVCYRWRKAGMAAEEVDRINAAILPRVIARGRVYISNATLGARFSLRACIINHRTTEADLDAVISEVTAAAREVES